MRSRRRRATLLWALVLAALVAGVLAGDPSRVADIMTYGSFDAPPSEAQSGVMYLAPGVKDLAIDVEYGFDAVSWHPVVALSALFLLVLFWRVFRSSELAAGSRRPIVQWLGFVLTRAGLLRVAGVLPLRRCSTGVLPVLNCHTCEMAAGACPIGAAQAFLRYGDPPLFVEDGVAAFALAAGRWFCGWLCPFGLVEDLLIRVSKPRLSLPRQLEWGRFAMLGLVAAVPLGMGLAGITSWFPFCSTVCPSGMILGLAPYYLTHGMPAVSEILADPVEHGAGIAVFAAPILGLIAYLALALSVGGRLFCRYLCPLGAFLGLFNDTAYVRVESDPAGCGSCTACHGRCPAGLTPDRDDFLARTGCLRCGRCVKDCSLGKRRWVFGYADAWSPEPSPEDPRKEAPG